MDPWACGSRYAGTIGSVAHQFYVKKGKVVTVYKAPYQKPRELLWTTPEAKCLAVDTTQKTVKASANVPAYTVLSRMKLMRGGMKLDVLVKSMSRKTPSEKRESVARAILAREDSEFATLYCSKAAYKANMSEKFAKAHPKASRCVLGSISEYGADFK
jgi:hypothetical protein